MTKQEILQNLVWKDAKQSGDALGNLKELYPNAEVLIVRKSKNGARRATVLLKQGDKVLNLICSETLTDLVRANKVDEGHLAGFPILYNEKQNQLYIGMPAQGWIEVKTIEVKDFKVKLDFSKDTADLI